MQAVVKTVNAHIGMNGLTAGHGRLARGAATASVRRISKAITPATADCRRVARWIRKLSIQPPVWLSASDRPVARCVRQRCRCGDRRWVCAACVPPS